MIAQATIVRKHVMSGGAGGGVDLPAFALLGSTDQASDAPLDVGGLAAVGTGFTAATGVFRWNVAANVVVVNGHRENQIAWTRNILELHPDYDPTQDILQMGIHYDVPVPIDAANPQYGLMHGILDEGPGAKATSNGLCHSLFSQSGVARQTAGVNATALGGTETFTGTPYRAVSTFFRAGPIAGSDIDMTGEWVAENTINAFFNGGRTDAQVPFQDDFSQWCLCVGHIKNNATSAATDMSARVYTRVVRTGGWFVGLP